MTVPHGRFKSARGGKWSENGVTGRLRTEDTCNLRKTSPATIFSARTTGEKNREGKGKHTVNGIDMSFREIFAKGDEFFSSYVKFKLMKLELSSLLLLNRQREKKRFTILNANSRLRLLCMLMKLIKIVIFSKATTKSTRVIYASSSLTFFLIFLSLSKLYKKSQVTRVVSQRENRVKNSVTHHGNCQAFLVCTSWIFEINKIVIN